MPLHDSSRVATATSQNLIDVAKAEVGYHEGFANGHWNNREKYAAEIGLNWVSDTGQPWCAVFVSWCAMKAGLADLFPCTASTDVGAAWFKNHGQWSEYPSVGAQVFYGVDGDMNHTGIVYAFDADYIYTIEGNTNASGSREGDGVYLKKRARRDAYVQGYGHPSYAPDSPAPKPTLLDRIRKQITKAVKAAKPGSSRRQKLAKARNDLPRKK